MAGEEWLRPEFKGREDELATREEYKDRSGVTPQSLSSHFTRYANRVPKVVKTFGKQKWFVATELDDFIHWIKENSGSRSDAEIKEAEIARLDVAISETVERVRKHEEAKVKAERDLARFKRQRRNAVSELEFLKQGS